jgi:hypothetical protein
MTMHSFYSEDIVGIFYTKFKLMWQRTDTHLHGEICFVSLVYIRTININFSMPAQMIIHANVDPGASKGTKVQLSDLHERANRSVVHGLLSHFMLDVHQGCPLGT